MKWKISSPASTPAAAAAGVAEVSLGGQIAPFGADLLFRAAGDPGFAVAIEIGTDRLALPPGSCRAAAAGATIVCNPAAEPALADGALRLTGLMAIPPEEGTITPEWTRSMESITACARARERAMSTESVSGGIAGASLSRTEACRTPGVGRAVPHDTAASAAKNPMIHRLPCMTNVGKTCKDKQILPTHAKIGL